MRVYCPLLKVEDQDDGTIRVFGVASSESKDRDGEVIKGDAMKAALPDFFAHGTGALREMHGLSAAGTVDEAEVDETNKTLIAATVVDPVAITKVRKGVYKGFSIGGRVLERDKSNRKVITKVSLQEISLVDRPANPDATLDLWKAEQMPAIDTREALKKAILAFDPAKDGDAERDAIIASAKSLDAVDFLPAPWQAIAKADAGDAEAQAETTAAETGDATAKADATATATDVTETAGDGARAAAGSDDAVAKAEAAVAALEAAVGKVAGVDGLAKGLYDVSRFAEVLTSISYLVSSATYEADAEGDNSPVPAALRDWIRQGASIFQAMAKEETDELIAFVTAQKAAAATDLAKSEAEEQGAEVPDAEALAKAVSDLTTERDGLAQMLAQREEAFAKLADRLDPLTKAVEQVQSDNQALRSELDEMKKRAAPPKTAASGIVSVSKEADAPGAAAVAKGAGPELSVEEARKVLADMSPDDRALLLMKAAHQRPIAVSPR